MTTQPMKSGSGHTVDGSVSEASKAVDTLHQTTLNDCLNEADVRQAGGTLASVVPTTVCFRLVRRGGAGR